MTNPTWAGRSATPPSPEDNRERPAWVPVAGVVAALGLVAAGGYILGSSTSSDALAATSASTTTEQAVVSTEPAEDETSSDDAAGENATVTTTEDGNADAEAESTASAGDEQTGGDAANDGATDGADANSADADAAAETIEDQGPQVIIEEGEQRGALLRDGVLYLGGEVPSREVADQIIERAAAVVGEDNVVDEYVINPAATMDQGAPLHVDDVVLFAYGANRYDPAFEPLLDLGLALLLQNPTVTITIVTHTDADGPASFNQQLSFERGQSVAQYWIDRGVEVERIVIDARGESDPRASNDTDEGAQLNRRAEFYIEGLLE